MERPLSIQSPHGREHALSPGLGNHWIAQGADPFDIHLNHIPWFHRSDPSFEGGIVKI